MPTLEGEFYGLWRERLTFLCTTTSHTVYSQPVPPGEVWYVDQVAIYDSTTAAADVLVGVETAGYLHVLGVQANAGAATWAIVQVDTYLREGERLRFDWSSVVAADILEMHISGERRILPMGQV